MLTGSKCSKSPDPATNRGSCFTKHENIVALITRYLSTTLTPLSSLETSTAKLKTFIGLLCTTPGISHLARKTPSAHQPTKGPIDTCLRASIRTAIGAFSWGTMGTCNVQRASEPHGRPRPPKKKTLPTCAPIPRLENCFFFDVLAKHFWRGASKSLQRRTKSRHQHRPELRATTDESWRELGPSNVQRGGLFDVIL